MKYIFEGKEYSTIASIHREWFPKRSSAWVTFYVKQSGCKTVKEVVALGVKRDAEARAKVIKNAKAGVYKFNQ